MTTTVQTRDEAQIRQLIADEQTAMRDRDADRLLARFAADAVKFDLAPPLRHTGPEVHDVAGLRQWFAGFAGPVELEIRDLQLTIGADLAYGHSLNCLSATPVGSAEGFALWFRSTVCLRKLDGTWRITHEHTSTPFYMDGTFRAATDLQP